MRSRASRGTLEAYQVCSGGASDPLGWPEPGCRGLGAQVANNESQAQEICDSTMCLGHDFERPCVLSIRLDVMITPQRDIAQGERITMPSDVQGGKSFRSFAWNSTFEGYKAENTSISMHLHWMSALGEASSQLVGGVASLQRGSGWLASFFECRLKAARLGKVNAQFQLAQRCANDTEAPLAPLKVWP